MDAGPLGWLVDMLHDAGSIRVVSGGMGMAYAGLSWPEIVAWVEGAQMHDVSPFWRRQIMHLSASLAGAMNTATEAEAPAPYEPGAI